MPSAPKGQPIPEELKTAAFDARFPHMNQTR